MHAKQNDSTPNTTTIFTTNLPENIPLQQLKLPESCTKSRLSSYKNGITTLPQPPELWQAFQRACNHGDSSQKLGNIIKDDPVLSASILRIANAPGLGVRIEITNITRAISHLGTSLVRSIVSQHAFSGQHSAGKVYDIHKLWKHGMAVSALAEYVADFIPNCDADIASTLGLFHDIGKMCFNLFPEYMLPAQLESETGHLIFEHQRFACTHVELGVLLANHWQLPEKIIQGIKHHHHPAFAESCDIPESIRAEVFAVYLADFIAIYHGLDTGDSGITVPQASFANMLNGVSLHELLDHPKVIAEIKRIDQVAF